jgi:hypothetical protein
MSRKNMPPGPGRPKGMPNKLTTQLKEALMEPFDPVAFAKWAKKNPSLYFVNIVTKLLPKDMNVALDPDNLMPTALVINFVEPDGATVSSRCNRTQGQLTDINNENDT